MILVGGIKMNADDRRLTDPPSIWKWMKQLGNYQAMWLAELASPPEGNHGEGWAASIKDVCAYISIYICTNVNQRVVSDAFFYPCVCL